MNASFEDICRFLKLSKSGHQDQGPYRLEKDSPSDTWYNIYDKNGQAVGQVAERYVKVPQ